MLHTILARYRAFALRKKHEGMFVRAAQTGDIATLAQLYASGAISPESFASFVGLHTAIKSGQVAVVKYLLDKDIPVPKGSLTPLMSAASSGQLDIIQLLLDRGAKINRTNANGDTALSLARKYHQTEAVEFLMARGAKE